MLFTLCDIVKSVKMCAIIFWMHPKRQWRCCLNRNRLAWTGPKVSYILTGEWLLYKFHVMRLDRYVGAFMYVILCCEILVLCFIIYFIVRECRKVYKQRKEYFRVSTIVPWRHSKCSFQKKKQSRWIFVHYKPLVSKASFTLSVCDYVYDIAIE